MITYRDWKIEANGILARQYDNLSRRVEVVGDLPEGWLWELLVQVGNAMDILPLEPMEGGVGHTLTADQLSIDGYYTVQLRGRKGEMVRHTNTTQVFVSKTLAGTGEWPTIPSQYSMVVTVSEVPDGDETAIRASHSAEEIIAQLERGWDVFLQAAISEGENKIGFELKPLGYYSLQDTEDTRGCIVGFGMQAMTGNGFVGIFLTVADMIDLVDDSRSVRGMVELGEMSESTLVNSVNGHSGEVRLTASDVGALTRSELTSAINTALAQAKVSGEFDGPQGPEGPQGPAGADGADGANGAPGKDNLPNVESVAGAAVALTLDNNVEYYCTDGVTALTIDGFSPATDGKVSMWAIQFTAGDSITVTIPDNVRWSIAEPVFTAGVGYWLSFVPLVNGDILGVWVSDE